MADEKVSIVLKVESHDRELKKLMVEMNRLKAMERRLSSGRQIENMAKRNTRSIGEMTRKWKRNFDQMDGMVAGTGKMLAGFLAKSIKGVIVQMLALSATMVAVHATFVAGQLIMKAYRGVMQLLAGGAAGATMAVAAFSAAIREQQAAMFAYRGKGAREFGSAMNQTRMAMRALQSDADLSTLGVEALNKAYASMSKTMSSRAIAGSTGAIKALMDFGSAGQDPAKGLEQVGAVLAALGDKKKNVSQVIAEAKKLGPEMEKALKGAKIRTKKDFEDLLMSGGLAKRGGVTGQFDAVNTTLMSTLKGYFSRLRTLFADFGDQFLEPLKVAFGDIFEIIRRDLTRIMGTIQSTIGYQGYIDGFVGMIDKASNWMVKMIREYLPNAMGMFERMGDWFDKFRRGWNLVLDRLRPLIDGARVLYKAWDPIWEAIKRASDNLFQFKDLLVENKDSMAEFGHTVGRFIDILARYFRGLQQMFKNMGPFISDTLKGLAGIFSYVTKLITSSAGSGLLGALGPLLGGSIMGKRMASIKGRVLPGVGAFNPQKMIVTADQVYVNGEAGPVAPQISSPASSGRLASGATGGGGTGALDIVGNVSLDDKLQKRAYAKFGSPGYMPIGEMYKDPRQTMFSSVLAGSRKAVERSTFYQRQNRRFNDRYGAGRGITFAATDLFTSRGTRTGFNAMTRMSRGDLAEYAVGIGIPVDSGMTRSQLIKAIQATPPAGGAPLPGLYGRGRMPYDHPLSRDRVSLTEGFRNTRINIGTRIGSGMDRLQRGVRRGIGGIRGFAGYANSGAFNYETGDYYDIEGSYDPATGRGSGVAGLRARRDAIKRERGFIGGMKADIDFMRDRNRLFRQYSKFGRAYNVGFAQSGMAKFGVSAGLGLLSQANFVPEESRGAIALGGMMGQSDPRLGLGIAGLGTAATSRGTRSAVLGGAIGGASMGAMVGPYGAMAGLVIGGIFGAIMSSINRGKEIAKQARKAAQESIGSIYTGLATAAAGQFAENQTILQSGGALRANTPGAFQNIFRDAKFNLQRLQNFALGIKQSVLPSLQEDKLKKYDEYIAKGLTPYEASVRASYSKEKADELIKENRGASAKTGGYGGMVTEPLPGFGSNQKLLAGEAAAQALTRIYENQSSFGLTITKEQLNKMIGGPDFKHASASLETLTGQGGTIELLGKYNDVVTNRLADLTEATGKTVPELEVLARELGVNLYDATIKYDTLLGKFTKNVLKTAAGFNAATSDRFLAGKNPFTQRREAKDAQLALDQEMTALGSELSKTKSKGGRQKVINKRMENYFNLALTAAGGDATQAYLATFEAFGMGQDAGAFGKGQIFEGFGADFAANEGMQESLAGLKSGFAKDYSTQLQAILAGAGYRMNAPDIERQILGMDFATLENFMKQVSNFGKPEQQFGAGGRVTPQSIFNLLTGKTSGQIEDMLASTGIAGEQRSIPDNLDTIADLDQKSLEKLGLIESGITELVNSFMMNPLSDAPAWWQAGLAWDDTNKKLVPPNQISTGDTRTPRSGSIGDTATSKLSQTMARHSAIDSQLTGKRTITSALRNYNLGSPSSDHVTGGAIDLVGQNLGRYATLARANGGFAEFHGSAGSRHLHVVPGAGIGDTTSIRNLGNMGTSTSSGVVNYYTFEINGGNQSPEQIANAVMAKISAKQQSMQERS